MRNTNLKNGDSKMKLKILFSTVLGLGVFSLSHMAAADMWYDGPCSAAEKAAPAPCIEVKIGEVYYHYNGGEFDEHAELDENGDPIPHEGHDDWHGLPPINDVPFSFSGR